MWQRLFAIVTALAWFGWSAGNASAEQRLALVIGNSAYESNLPLSNPQNDAQAVAQLVASTRGSVSLHGVDPQCASTGRVRVSSARP